MRVTDDVFAEEPSVMYDIATTALWMLVSAAIAGGIARKAYRKHSLTYDGALTGKYMHSCVVMLHHTGFVCLNCTLVRLSTC